MSELEIDLAYWQALLARSPSATVFVPVALYERAVSEGVIDAADKRWQPVAPMPLQKEC